MHRLTVFFRPMRRLLTVLASCALLLTLASCSTGGTARPMQLEIATLFAVSGTDGVTQLPVQYGVDLAVSQAHLPDGYTLSVAHENYSVALDAPNLGATASRAVATIVHTLVNNTHVVGICSHLSPHPGDRARGGAYTLLFPRANWSIPCFSQLSLRWHYRSHHF
jgi:hypothetical protein